MTIAVASQKGGTGKTTTSISLAAGLAHKGKKVLLIDVDSQANSSKVLLPDYRNIKKEQTVYHTIINRQPLSVHQTTVKNLDLIPAHILLSSTDVELTVAKDHREARLKRELDPIKGNYDFIFIDCPPALGWLTLNALTASDKVIVVVSPGYFEVEAIDQIADTIRETKTDHKRQEEPVFQNETKSSTPVRDVLPVRPVPLVPLERDVRPVPRTKRIMKQRHPFDIYHDQYDTLKQFAEEECRQGGIGSMSAMVREAIDTFTLCAS